jgi:hypothetical protein
MSAIDHAAAHLRVEPRAERRPWPAASRAALAFAAAQIPLTLIALVLEWRGTWGVPDEHGPLLEDFLRYGSGISGPLAPQLILLVLAFGARRDGRLGRVAGGGIGVMGLLIAFNGLMAGFSDATWTPRAALVAAAVFFGSAGVALIVTGVRRVVRS